MNFRVFVQCLRDVSSKCLRDVSWSTSRRHRDARHFQPSDTRHVADVSYMSRRHIGDIPKMSSLKVKTDLSSPRPHFLSRVRKIEKSPVTSDVFIWYFHFFFRYDVMRHSCARSTIPVQESGVLCRVPVQELDILCCFARLLGDTSRHVSQAIRVVRNSMSVEKTEI